MGSKSDYLENALLNQVLRNIAYTPSATVYVALFTVTTSDAGGGTEVTGGSYARQSIAFDAAASGTTQNTAEVAFPEATAGWGTVVAFGLYDAVTSGNLLYWGDISPNKTVDSGDTARFAAGDLTVTED
jgi:hypothetical protein